MSIRPWTQHCQPATDWSGFEISSTVRVVNPIIRHEDGTWECGACGSKFANENDLMHHRAFGKRQR